VLEPTPDLIPAEILKAYYPGDITSQVIVPGGDINTTLLVTDTNGKKTILQRISSIYNAAIGEDYEVVADHLREKGWEMAIAHKASNGATYLPDRSGQLWRSFSYIESVPGTKFEGDLEAAVDLGGILGDLHRSLATLDYQPKFKRTHSQNTEYYADKLETMIPEIQDAEYRELTKELISLSRATSIASYPLQLIHSDPRIGNTLFRQGKPFTFIDWDGFRIANPLVDVGDMLQSVVGEVINKSGGSLSAKQLHPIIEAYYHKSGSRANRQAFMKDALTAGRVIALILGMRCLIDSVEDSYFRWNPARFGSRLEYNLFRAQNQRQIYEVLV